MEWEALSENNYNGYVNEKISFRVKRDSPTEKWSLFLYNEQDSPEYIGDFGAPGHQLEEDIEEALQMIMYYHPEIAEMIMSEEKYDQTFEEIAANFHPVIMDELNISQTRELVKVLDVIEDAFQASDLIEDFEYVDGALVAISDSHVFKIEFQPRSEDPE